MPIRAENLFLRSNAAKSGSKHQPQTKDGDGRRQKSGKIGVVAKQAVNRSPIAIAEYGFVQTWNVMKQIFAALGAMLHGFSLNDLGGPVAMYSYTSKAAQYGVVSVISLLAFLSVNLGIVNLLPIPALMAASFAERY